jgi:WD40 repeat protein
VSWDLVTNSTRKVFYGKFGIFCLALHPDDPEVAAFGCKMGLVLIVTLASRGGRILHKMRGHKEDCYALSWSPTDKTKVIHYR